MSTLVVSLALATACLGNTCFNVIIGKPSTPTPIGKYSVYYATTPNYGYGGELLVFKETNDSVYSIHRPYTGLNPSYRRNLLLSNNSNRKISNGCINIPEEIFDEYKHSITEVIIK